MSVMYRLTINLPNSSEGQKLELDGLGYFTNGSTVEVSEADAKKFKPFTRMEGIELKRVKAGTADTAETEGEESKTEEES